MNDNRKSLLKAASIGTSIASTLAGLVLCGFFLGKYLDALWGTHPWMKFVHSAIRRMRRSFFVRLGIITLVVVGVARFQKVWLPSFTIGIAVGILLSLIIMVRRQIISGKE